jgi:hypothetical protein
MWATHQNTIGQHTIRHDDDWQEDEWAGDERSTSTTSAAQGRRE